MEKSFRIDDNKGMKKILFLLALLMPAFSLFAEESAKNKVEFGLGSGYVFYGDTARKRIDKISGSSQFIVAGDAAYLVRLNGPVYFCLGGDLTFDAHWKGSDHVYCWDYCFDAGFRIYPGLAGLACTVNYCLGRRTDFIELPGEPGTESSSWGNGFKFGIAYDFSYNSDGFAPEVGINFRRMPRGGNESDNILGVFLRIKS